MQLQLREKYAFLIAHVRTDQLAKTAQPLSRLKHTRASSQCPEFDVFGKNASHGICVELFPRKLYQSLFLDEMLSHAVAPVIFYTGNGLNPNSAVILSSRALGIASDHQRMVVVARQRKQRPHSRHISADSKKRS
jgi:hypothetical protein